MESYRPASSNERMRWSLLPFASANPTVPRNYRKPEGLGFLEWVSKNQRGQEDVIQRLEKVRRILKAQDTSSAPACSMDKFGLVGGPFDAHQDACYEHKERRSNEHDGVDVVGMLLFAHDCVLLRDWIVVLGKSALSPRPAGLKTTWNQHDLLGECNPFES